MSCTDEVFGRLARLAVVQRADPADHLARAGHHPGHLPDRRHQLGDGVLGGDRVIEHRRVHARFRRPRKIPVCAMSSATASNTRSGRSEAAIRLRQYTRTDGSKLIASSDRPQATFHRRSYFSASAVWVSDRSYSSLSTSTEPARSAGSDGRPVRDGNRSAMKLSGNSSVRCSARNANTLPGATRCPVTSPASSRSRSVRELPCMRRSSQRIELLAGRNASLVTSYL